MDEIAMENIEAPPAAATADMPDTPEFRVKMKTLNVNVHYAEKHALRDVSLDIGEREVTALIGAVGLRQVHLPALPEPAMNDTIDICRVTGRLELDGQDIYDAGVDVVQLRASIGMVFQKPNPFPKSIFDNVAYGPRIHGLVSERTDLEEIVEQSLHKAGLYDEVKDRLGDPGTSLSGGQQQRLCIAPGDRRRPPR